MPTIVLILHNDPSRYYSMFRIRKDDRFKYVIAIKRISLSLPLLA